MNMWQPFLANASRYLHVKMTISAQRSLATNVPFPKKPAKTFDYQQLLPRLPVPSLNDTCSRYLKSVQPLLDSQQYARTESITKDFLGSNEARHLQNLLVERASKSSTSWLEQWWNDLAYLTVREPVLIHVNYGYGFKDDPNDKNIGQSRRAALLVKGLLAFKGLIETELLEPDLSKSTPLCMVQYKYLFGSCRIPGKTRDLIETVDSSQVCHIVVARKGQFYALNVIDKNGTLASANSIETRLNEIIKDADAKQLGPQLGVFTGEERTRWSDIRHRLVEYSRKNDESFQKIQTSLFLVCLDTEAPKDMDQLSMGVLHGDGYNRWFDKQFQLIVFANGRAGLNCEHALIDGTTTLRMADFAYEQSKREEKNSSTPTAVETATRIEWDLSRELSEELERSSEPVQRLIMNNESAVLDFDFYGGNHIKSWKCSPDAFVQMALQLAHYRCFGTWAPTYESASTKKFFHGRTETCRSVSSESIRFVETMLDRGLRPVEKWNLLEAACRSQLDYMKMAKEGQGVDRHLMGLKLLALENGVPMPSLFEDPACDATRHWRLSTSNCGLENLALFTFGPVVEDGFGVGYVIHENDISVSVTSKRSCPTTNSRLFVRALEKSLLDMRDIASPSSKL